MAAVKHQELLDARIAADESARQEHRRNYIKEVSSQIASKDELQRRAREEFFKEGEAIAREQAEQLERLESIRRRKLAELRALGVPDIFTTELQKLRFDD